jgi:hypothetical protein
MTTFEMEKNMSTREEALAAKKELGKDLLRNFSEVSRLPVNRLGIDNDEHGYFVRLYVQRELTSEEIERLPQQHAGVRVTYQVGGPIYPL